MAKGRVRNFWRDVLYLLMSTPGERLYREALDVEATRYMDLKRQHAELRLEYRQLQREHQQLQERIDGDDPL